MPRVCCSCQSRVIFFMYWRKRFNNALICTKIVQDNTKIPSIRKSKSKMKNCHNNISKDKVSSCMYTWIQLLIAYIFVWKQTITKLLSCQLSLPMLKNLDSLHIQNYHLVTANVWKQINKITTLSLSFSHISVTESSSENIFFLFRVQTI